MRNGARALADPDALLSGPVRPVIPSPGAANNDMRHLTRNALAMILVSVALCACGSGKDAAGAGHTAATKRKLSAQEQLNRSLVSAFTQTKLGSRPLPLDVKFALTSKPDLSQPVEVVVAIVPTAGNLDRIYGHVEGDEGLDVVGSGELEEEAKPVENTPIQRSVKLQAKKDGIYTVTAVITVDSGGQVGTQNYSFPLIAGKGLPDAPAAPSRGAATPATASAQASAGSSR